MKFFISSVLFATASQMFTTASVIPEIQSRDCHVKKPAAFYLAGDSTTAAQSAGGGGKFSYNKIYLEQ